MRLPDLYFGLAAAENEVAIDPDRFVDTYFDHWDLAQSLESHRRFLLLGAKGTGKSAAARYLALRWKRSFGEESVFATFADFDDLNRTQTPLASLDKRLVGDVPALTDSAWRLFLGVRLLDSLLSDAACDLAKSPPVLEFAGRLRSLGLASDDYPQVLRRVRERKASIALPKIAGYESRVSDSDEIGVGQVGDALFEILLNARTRNRHLLVIDGLDKAIGDRPAYWETLAALVRVVDGLNRRIRESNPEHLFVLVLCRSDVFRRVRFADAAKIAADGGVYLDWVPEAEDPSDVLLWDFLCKKAGIDRETLFGFLPSQVEVGKWKKAVNIDRYLLDKTRYTPRDLTLLFNCLQEKCTSDRMSGAQVRRGVDAFATRHLLTEVMSEAHGLLAEPLINRFEQIISELPSRTFTRSDLEAAVRASDIDAGLAADLGEYLFLQGAIGNFREGANYTQFYHRRDAYKFRKDGPWILHTGLVYAFNLPWS